MTRNALLRRILLVCAIVIGMAIAYRPGYLQLQAMHAKLDRAQAENIELEREHAALVARVDELQNDALAIEREARQRLGLVLPGDVIYKFPEDGATNPAIEQP